MTCAGCTPPASRVRYHHANLFANPGVQGPAGTTIDPSQRFVLTEPTYAIAIAPDSQVAEADLYFGNGTTIDRRIRIGDGAPFVGFLDHVATPNVLACPVRPHMPVSADAQYPDEVISGLYPRLRLAIYTGAPPTIIPPRPPVVATWRGTASGVIRFVLPVAGRRVVSWAFRTSNYGGAGPVTSVAPGLVLHHDVLNVITTAMVTLEEARVVPTPGSGIVEAGHACADGAVSGGTNRSGSGHWTTAVLTLTPDAAGTFDYDVKLAAS